MIDDPKPRKYIDPNAEAHFDFLPEGSWTTLSRDVFPMVRAHGSAETKITTSGETVEVHWNYRFVPKRWLYAEGFERDLNDPKGQIKLPEGTRRISVDDFYILAGKGGAVNEQNAVVTMVPGSRRRARGRPAKHATATDKRRADAKRKRIKRTSPTKPIKNGPQTPINIDDTK